MFSDDALKKMEIDPDRCRSKARLYKSMACQAREKGFSPEFSDATTGPTSLRSQELSDSMHEGHVGYLYQVSAECMLVLEDKEGHECAAHAGEAYLKGGLPFGLVLSAIFEGASEYSNRPKTTDINDFLEFRERIRLETEEYSERDKMRAEALERPEQLIWLLIAVTNIQDGRSLLVKWYKPIRDSFENRGHLPVGPLGIPVSAHFPLFDAILSKQSKSSALNEVFNFAMARRAQALNLAKRNLYLWERVRSPLALFDLHIFALANAAALCGLLNEKTVGDMRRSLDNENPLSPLILAPLNKALDYNAAL
ncbi:MAG: hypothetical protein AAF098_17235 [Pseudomonadota bacterium]